MLKEKMAKKAARQEQMRLEREAKRKVSIRLLSVVCFVFLDVRGEGASTQLGHAPVFVFVFVFVRFLAFFVLSCFVWSA